LLELEILMKSASAGFYAAFISVAAPCSAAVLDFETKPGGTPTVSGSLVGADYSSLGVTFDGAYYFTCPSTCPAPASGKFISGFVTAKAFTATFATPVDSVSFNNIGGLSLIDFVAYGSNGTALGSGSSSSFPTATTVSFGGIKSISFFPTVLAHLGTNYGGIDNLTFASAQSAPGVPEPATWAMMIGGFGMVGGSMRYRRRRRTMLPVMGR
jgi:hypothetical protein